MQQGLVLPDVHLCLVQPLGYVHSLGFIDQARYFRHQFRRMGAQVTVAKNRLRHDAVNFVFGAHLGFDPGLRERHSCIFVNLEQLGQGGAQVNAGYLELLRRSAVVDYDADNLAAYAQDASEVPVLPFGHAPYLAPASPLPLEERPIDLLFFGSMNPRRQALIARIEAQGWQVGVFDRPLYGAERDEFILQSKAVLNVHFYEASRFEQARASTCLSLGTPVVSELGRLSRPPAAFERCASWVDEASFDDFFARQFGTPAFFESARAQLEQFRRFDPIEAYADVLAFAAGFAGEHMSRRPREPWRPKLIHLGSGKDYKPGWLNLDVLPRAQPDLVLDLGRPQSLPLRAESPFAGPVELVEGSVDAIVANNVLEPVPDLPCLMTQCLALLATGGSLVIEVPYERARTAWQDPTHLRAMNEMSWVYYNEWFWYLGWFEHRFQPEQFSYLDDQLQACTQERAAFMKLTLRKVATTPYERTVARTMSADPMLPDDAWALGVTPAATTTPAAGQAVAPMAEPTPTRLPRPINLRDGRFSIVT